MLKLRSISSKITAEAAVLVWQYLTLYVQFCAPDDGRRYHLKHVEQFIEINRSRKRCILLVVLYRFNHSVTFTSTVVFDCLHLSSLITLRASQFSAPRTLTNIPNRFSCLLISFGLFLDVFNTLKPELNPICYLLALLGAHHFLHVSRIRVKLLTFRLLMSYIYIHIYIYIYIYIYIWRTHSWCF